MAPKRFVSGDEAWREIRKGQLLGIVRSRATRPRAISAIPKSRRLLAEIDEALMRRLDNFIRCGRAGKPFNYYIERLLSEALDHRGYFANPGRGGNQHANTDIDLHPLSLELSHADDEQ